MATVWNEGWVRADRSPAPWASVAPGMAPVGGHPRPPVVCARPTTAAAATCTRPAAATVRVVSRRGRRRRRPTAPRAVPGWGGAPAPAACATATAAVRRPHTMMPPLSSGWAPQSARDPFPPRGWALRRAERSVSSKETPGTRLRLTLPRPTTSAGAEGSQGGRDGTQGGSEAHGDPQRQRSNWQLAQSTARARQGLAGPHLKRPPTPPRPPGGRAGDQLGGCQPSNWAAAPTGVPYRPRPARFAHDPHGQRAKPNASPPPLQPSALFMAQVGEVSSRAIAPPPAASDWGG